MASADLREELNCSICLSIYTDPVMLSCGHNFCRRCIGDVLDTQEGSGVYTCPECRAEYQERPAPQRNLKLCNIAEHFLSTHPEQEETEICCTYCVHSFVPASKTCLMCEASLCDTHLRVHSKSEDHVLTEPTIYITNRKCSVHTELLKYYCHEDAVCVCASCGLFGEHKGHHVELLNLASEKKKEKLRDVMVNLTSNKEEIEKRVQSLQEQMRKVQEKAHGMIEMISAMFRDIREQLEVQAKRVLGEIRQSDQDLLKVSNLIQRLEIQKDELSKQMCLVEELCSMTDPLNILQGGDYDKVRGITGVNRDNNELPALNELDDVLISVTLQRALTDIVTDVIMKRGLCEQEDSDILLDVNTAGKCVNLSGDLKTASYSTIQKVRPNRPERFITLSQVLSNKTILSGKYYWECNIKGSGTCGVGMAYPSINRKGKQSLIGINNKSWCLGKIANNYFAVHDSRQIKLVTKSSCTRLGIFLDYEAGRLSFYELCDPVRLLHTFTASFTEPLHVALYVSVNSEITIRSFVSGRQTSDNTRRLIDTLTFMRRKGTPSLTLSTDAEKAFDRVNWDFLMATLQKFGLAYITSPEADSEKFKISNGSRQGCPLSPLLFALFLEPLAILLRDSTEVEGIKIDSTPSQIISVGSNVARSDIFSFVSCCCLYIMASDLREELNCSICLSIYTDPVMLSCGHNFCQGCIGDVLDTQEGSGVYTCPECRAEYQERPAPQRNLKLCNIVQCFLSARPEKEEVGIVCTYCVHFPVPAVKTCILCEASLCDIHLRVHSKSEEHILTDPTTCMTYRKCSSHKKLLEYYCYEDAVCICASCCAFGEHRGHQVELLNEASEKKKVKLRDALEKLTLEREDAEKRVQTLQEHRRHAEDKAVDIRERVTALFQDIRKQLEDLEKRVLSEISRQEEQVSLQISHLIQQLEIQKHELSRKMCHIEELCNITDSLTVLQGCESDKDIDLEYGKRDKEFPTLNQVDEVLTSLTLHRVLADIVMDVKVKRGFYVQEAPDILLDVNTAGNYVAISNNLKTATRLERNQQRPKQTERFITYSQVLSTKHFSSGQHYWEVETSESGNWCVGMAYPSIEREGEQSCIGDNNKSWCLGMINKHYAVFHDSVVMPVTPEPSYHRLGIYLDYEAGRLSFYQMCDPVRLLHTFTATFTEQLHVAFSVYGAWVRIK
ncbi:uncharacterized protein O3C94_023537 [Discoglossus pictus]